jgi:hypothetical protein
VQAIMDNFIDCAVIVSLPMCCFGRRDAQLVRRRRLSFDGRILF